MPKKTAVNFTRARVERHKAAGDKRSYLWDSQVPGLGIEAAPTGRRSWLFQYRILGKQSRITFGRYPALPLEDARSEAQRLATLVRQGMDPRVVEQERTGALSVADVVERYTGTRYFLTRSPDYRLNFHSVMKNHVLPKLGSMKIRDVTRGHVRTLVDDLIERGREGNARRVVRDGGVLFRWALDHELIEADPCYRLRPQFTTTGRRDRWLSEEEIAAAWNAPAKVQTRLFIRWLLLTGCRRDEARLTRFEDLQGGVWTVETTKQGTPHTLPVMPAMELVVAELREAFPLSSWLFPAVRSWRSPIARSSVNQAIAPLGFTPHVLRHTVETHMRELGIGEEARALVLGHALPGTGSRVYAHGQALEIKRAALKTWHEWLLTQVATL